jgi:hypothetical protein
MRNTVFIFLMLLSVCLKAQQAEFTASASPDVLHVGEQFNLTFTSNQELTDLELPEIANFQLLGGPSQSHSQSVYSANGKITSTSTWQYTYFFQALKEGKYTIPPASARIKNKNYESNSVSIEVVAAETQPSSQGQGEAAKTQEQSGSINDKDLFISLILDKKEAYIGEQIIATIKIYTTVNLSEYDRGFKGPDFTGFFIEPIDVPPLRNLEREALNGQIYYSGVLKKMMIIPQKAGELTIQPFDLDVAVRKEVRRRSSDPFFDDFFMSDVQDVPVTLKSKSVKILVKHLPPNTPVSFKGAVGDFNMTSSISKTNTVTNDPFTIKLTVSGKGNIKLISEIDLNIPVDMEKYDPVINTNLNNPLSGSKTFEYMVMPRIAGNYTIPPAEFTFFDPVNKQYKTIKGQAFNVNVTQGQGDSLMAIAPGMVKEDVKVINQDIRFIKTKLPRLTLINAYIAVSPVYFLLYGLFLIIFITLVILHNRIKKQNADITNVRLRKADKFARNRLKKSAVLLRQGNESAFYEEILGALWGYMSDKLKIPVSSLSKDTAVSVLKEKMVDQDFMDDLFNIIDNCEMARYARSSEGISMERIYHDALDIIVKLQQKLKS